MKTPKITLKSIKLENNQSHSLQELFETAFDFHRAGRLDDAERTYRKILVVDPVHSNTRNLLGLLVHQKGAHDEALELIAGAIRINPKASYFNNIGLVYSAMGDLNRACESFQEAIRINPYYVQAYLNLGDTFDGLKEADKALAAFQKAIELKPGLAEAHLAMGYILENEGRVEAAIACYEAALAGNNKLGEAHFNLGNIYLALKREDQAIRCFRNALTIQPNDPQIHNNLGTAFRHRNRLMDALDSFQAALALAPNSSITLSNLGTTLRDLGELEVAVSCYRDAIRIDPENAKAHNNLGNLLFERQMPREAIYHFETAIRIDPKLVDAYRNLGGVYQETGKPNQAIFFYEQALKYEPNHPESLVKIFQQYQNVCNWRQLDELAGRLDRLNQQAFAAGDKTPEPPLVHISRCARPESNLNVSKSWSDQISRRMSNLTPSFSFEPPRTPQDKITVGYLSNDFRAHPVAHLMLGLYGMHNRDRFNIYCYSLGKDDGSKTRKTIRQSSDRFIDLQYMSHLAAARRIHDDKVDVLVDLMGHTLGNRLEICALRPAPVQVSYLGFLSSTGADFIDYIITDKQVTPEDQIPYYLEKPVYMPDCFMVNDHTQPISSKVFMRKDFGLPEDGVVFCSFNNTYKIEPVMFETWMNILLNVPGSTLWLFGKNEVAENNIKQEAIARGIRAERIVFAGKLPLDEHLARLKLADLALDTRVYNGGATTSNALWAGLPVLTLMGSHFVSRMSASCLHAIGLPELITDTLKDYESVAIGLALNPDRLKSIQQRLRENRLAAPLFDTQRFVENIETAYNEMWQVFCSGEKPRVIEVSGEKNDHY